MQLQIHNHADYPYAIIDQYLGNGLGDFSSRQYNHLAQNMAV